MAQGKHNIYDKEQVRAAARIVDFLPTGGATRHEARRDSAFICCPFHQEKTPSCKVDTKRNTFYCFGCKASGDVFDFVGRLRFPGYDRDRMFADVIEYLGDHYHLQPSMERRPDAQRDLGLRLLSEFAASAHEHLLKGNEPFDVRARDYFYTTRGFTEKHAVQFNVGAVTGMPAKDLITWARHRGYGVDLLVRTGLLAVSREKDVPLKVRMDDGVERDAFLLAMAKGGAVLDVDFDGARSMRMIRGEQIHMPDGTPAEPDVLRQATYQSGFYFPVFSNRLVLPVSSPVGDVVGFTARFVPGDDPVKDAEKRKYVNTRNTEFFNKGSMLYGANLLPSWCEGVVLVEGGLDLVRVAGEGIPAGCPLGTSCTADQVSLLLRRTEHLYLCLDNDAAGTKAMMSLAENVYGSSRTSCFCHVVRLAGGKDPDEVIAKQGIGVFRDAMLKAEPYPAFYLRTLMQQAGTEVAAAGALRQGESAAQDEQYRRCAAVGREFGELLAKMPDQAYAHQWRGVAVRQLHIPAELVGMPAEVMAAAGYDRARLDTMCSVSAADDVVRNIHALAKKRDIEGVGLLVGALNEKLAPGSVEYPQGIAGDLLGKLVGHWTSTATFTGIRDQLTKEEFTYYQALVSGMDYNALDVGDLRKSGWNAVQGLALDLKVVKCNQALAAVAQCKTMDENTRALVVEALQGAASKQRSQSYSLSVAAPVIKTSPGQPSPLTSL